MKHKIREFFGQHLSGREAAEMLGELINHSVSLELFRGMADHANLPVYFWPYEQARHSKWDMWKSQGFTAFSECYVPMSTCGRYELEEAAGYAYALKALTTATKDGKVVRFDKHCPIKVYGGLLATWLPPHAEALGYAPLITIGRESEQGWEFEAVDINGQPVRWLAECEALQYVPWLVARFATSDIRALAEKIAGDADEKPEPKQSKGDQEPQPRKEKGKQALQESYVLKTMHRLGMDPLAYPYPGSGRKGAMSIIINEILPEGRKQVRREELDGVPINLSYPIITKAWERLRGSGKIRSEKEISESAAPACKSGADAGT